MKSQTAASRSQTSKKVVAVSGGFDPLHIGHVRMFQEARALGDSLVVILNNDNWLRTKKGHVFMSQRERREIIKAIEGVDRVVYTSHQKDDPDRTVCRDLAKIRPHIFANGGDRAGETVPEVRLCKALGIKLAFNVGRGGKVQSSSWLVAAAQAHPNTKKEKIAPRTK